MVWVGAALIAIICGIVVLLPVIRAGRRAGVPEDTTEEGVAFYKAQLEGIDRDLKAGELDADSAEKARAEAARTLLAQADGSAGSGAGPVRRGPVAVGLALLIGLAVGGALYVVFGAPALPDMPLETREDVRVEREIQAVISEVEARLEASPDDVRGWRAIAPVYVQRGRYDDAVNARQRIIALEGESADNLTDLAVSLTARDAGTVGPEAREALARAAVGDPDHIPSRFYLAIAAMQAANFAIARHQWMFVIERSPADAPWLEAARQGLAEAQMRLTAAEMDLDTSDPSGTIAGMVAGLAARLAEDGGTPQEWARLVRSRVVMGDLAQAERDRQSAREQLSEPGARDAFEAAIIDLGLDDDGGPQ